MLPTTLVDMCAQRQRYDDSGSWSITAGAPREPGCGWRPRQVTAGDVPQRSFDGRVRDRAAGRDPGDI